MENTYYTCRVWAAAWLMVLLVTALSGLAGCATTMFDHGRGIRTVWQGRDQFVAIERQGPLPGGTPVVNTHPVEVPVDRIRSAFATITVRLPDRDDAVPLFHDPELQILGENIHRGLAAAGPDEDVTFAVIGQHALLAGFLKERTVTTGRVFCRDGRLTIIFGEVLRDVKENEDPRLHPLQMGSRSKTSPHDWVLAAKSGSAGFTLVRPDWITFPLTAPEVPDAATAPPEAGNSVRSPPKTVPLVSPERPSTKPGIAERLKLLNELRDRHLITDEEYRSKRQQILDAL
ncbi:MAG TPA: SHOCT domain-containing protein [Desulfuromonadaceae bacterium]